MTNTLPLADAVNANFPSRLHRSFVSPMSASTPTSILTRSQIAVPKTYPFKAPYNRSPQPAQLGLQGPQNQQMLSQERREPEKRLGVQFLPRDLLNATSIPQAATTHCAPACWSLSLFAHAHLTSVSAQFVEDLMASLMHCFEQDGRSSKEAAVAEPMLRARRRVLRMNFIFWVVVGFRS